MERKRWSQADVEKFNRAWEYLKEREPNIQEKCREFNETNGRGLVTTFWAEKFQWGTLLGTKLASGEKRAQRFVDDMYGKGTGVSLAVNTIFDDEANLIGGFAVQLGNTFNLKVRREFGRPNEELTELRYSLKPHFEQFK